MNLPDAGPTGSTVGAPTRPGLQGQTGRRGDKMSRLV